jgi:hypothetical protein
MGEARIAGSVLPPLGSHNRSVTIVIAAMLTLVVAALLMVVALIVRRTQRPPRGKRAGPRDHL